MKILRYLRDRRQDRSGQALVEFMFVAGILLLLLFGLIDFCRALSVRQVITNLTREGSNLASRGTPMLDAMDAVVASAVPLNIDTASGKVIITAIINVNDVLIVTNQVSRGQYSASSKIGPDGIGSTVSTGLIPSTPVQIPKRNRTLYVTEVFYDFQLVTPVGKLLFQTSESSRELYDVAFF
jgi:Flp pilus assembly protein TadG